MHEYILLFRHSGMSTEQPSPEQMQESIQQWQSWIGGIAAQGKLVSTNQLGQGGSVLKSGGVTTDGPYAEIKETLGGYTIVKAANHEEAVTMSHGCPILHVGGNVEIRPILSMNN